MKKKQLKRLQRKGRERVKFMWSVMIFLAGMFFLKMAFRDMNKKEAGRCRQRRNCARSAAASRARREAANRVRSYEACRAQNRAAQLPRRQDPYGSKNAGMRRGNASTPARANALSAARRSAPATAPRRSPVLRDPNYGYAVPRDPNYGYAVPQDPNYGYAVPRATRSVIPA